MFTQNHIALPSDLWRLLKVLTKRLGLRANNLNEVVFVVAIDFVKRYGNFEESKFVQEIAKLYGGQNGKTQI